MTAHIDAEALRSSLQRLRESAFDGNVSGVMKRTVDAVHGVFGYGGAGVMFITEPPRESLEAKRNCKSSSFVQIAS